MFNVEFYMLVNSNMSNMLSFVQMGSISRCKCVLVVYSSHINQRIMAQGGYWVPLVPLPKCLVRKGFLTFMHWG